MHLMFLQVPSYDEGLAFHALRAFSRILPSTVWRYLQHREHNDGLMDRVVYAEITSREVSAKSIEEVPYQ